MSNAKAYMDQFNNMFDFSQFAEMGRKQAEAFTAANQIAMEGIQAASRRQAEVAQESLQNVIEASKEVMSSGTPEVGLAKQAELTKHLFENGVENLREVSEMVTKSSQEAFDVINKSASSNVTDFTQASGPSGQKKASKKK